VTLLDGVTLGLLGAFVVLGAIRGLVRDLASLVGLVAGAYLSWRHGPQVSAWLQPMIRDNRWALFLGYALTFFGVVLAATLVGVFLSRLLHETPLGWLDRLLGAALGMAKAVILVWALVTITLLVRPDGRERVNASPLTDAIVGAGSRIIGTYRGLPKTRDVPGKPTQPRHRGDYVTRPEDDAGLSGM